MGESLLIFQMKCLLKANAYPSIYFSLKFYQTLPMKPLEYPRVAFQTVTTKKNHLKFYDFWNVTTDYKDGL